MASKEHVIILDDLDGTEGAKPYTFGIGDAVYDIDLTDEHRLELLRLLAPYVEHARRRPRTNARAASRERRDAEMSELLRKAVQQAPAH